MNDVLRNDPQKARALATEKMQAIEQIYPKLKQLARQRLARHRTLTLFDVTSLVNEALLKMLGTDLRTVDDKHLIGYTAHAMRSIVVDYERERASLKRNGGERTSLTDLEIPVVDSTIEILKLDEAMKKLETFDPDLVKLVELRFFAGLNLTEISEEIGRSERSLKRDWQRARAFLKNFLGD
jgi:RNA polymerase sigma factor (TIGR02999 family)